MNVIRFYCIEWDFDKDDNPILPDEVFVRCDDVENITEEELEYILADNSDWCFKRFNYEIIDEDEITL